MGREFGGTVMNMGLSSLTLGELHSLQRKIRHYISSTPTNVDTHDHDHKTSNTDNNQGEGGEF